MQPLKPLELEDDLVCLGQTPPSSDQYDLIVMVVLADRSGQQETSFSSVSRSSPDIP
jgi:hypothetical protein